MIQIKSVSYFIFKRILKGLHCFFCLLGFNPLNIKNKKCFITLKNSNWTHTNNKLSIKMKVSFTFISQILREKLYLITKQSFKVTYESILQFTSAVLRDIYL